MKTTTAAESLKLVLADTFVLYMKTYAVHWNYKGSKFFSVHKLTEEHYEELADAIDAIAERIRSKGDEAPISLQNILRNADLKEIQQAEDDIALDELVEGHVLLAKRAKQAAGVCELEGDLYSNDMMIGRIGAHEKAAWMLRSFLTGGGSEKSRVSPAGTALSGERPLNS
jgi:starvation-inducible DNA-binding protein